MIVLGMVSFRWIIGSFGEHLVFEMIDAKTNIGLWPDVRITQQKYITSLNVYFRRFEMVLSIFVIQKVKDVIFVVDILFSKCRKTSLLDFCSYSTLRIMSFFN